jgi:hypothetical protein
MYEFTAFEHARRLEEALARLRRLMRESGQSEALAIDLYTLESIVRVAVASGSEELLEHGFEELLLVEEKLHRAISMRSVTRASGTHRVPELR